MRRLSWLCLTGVLVLFATAEASAIPLTVNGGWQEVEWECPPYTDENPVGTCAQPSTTVFNPTQFEFTLATDGVLKFTDLYNAGDEFVLTLNGTPYSTSAVQTADDGFKLVGSTYFGEYDLFYGLDAFSKLTLALAPGDYVLTFAITNFAPLCDNDNGPCTNPQTGQDWLGGIAAVRVDETAPVPEPASLLLLGSGLASLGAAARRRRNR